MDNVFRCYHSECLLLTADSPGCECGFMSVERMRILLRLDNVYQRSFRTKRQQITPDIRFTCDGMITKWIIGAYTAGGSFNPELQVWRNIGNDVYQKINGTFIDVTTSRPNRIYEYSNFSPIPFQAGDILGVFIPGHISSNLVLLSEYTTSPTNYYLTTDSTDSESPYDMMDISSVMSQGYHPLVSVEISKQA